jgi:N-acetylglutamate synthase-like GNAT family acetyltransferase
MDRRCSSLPILSQDGDDTVRIEYLGDNAALIPTLAQWHYEQWRYLYPNKTIEQYIARLHTHLDKKQIPTTFVALTGGILMGSSGLVSYDMDTQRDLSPWLSSLYVSPIFRGRGIGSALVHRTIKEAEALGVETLYVFTPDREGFYRHLGWSIVERTEYRGYVVAIMAREIAPPHLAA